ncbi:hypothetical protein KL86PLE_40349 [uncultured Pleomorphomonas sp.]|uniref:Uncharacterized protein n=1 Tax=uncultured Pleomorphomonas sp. TaxID=442121 RepID=A0A212LG57_9HYPH|nr:hypothetical protein KL86PLE_40349 [uncultured Pleomorphomonas sp.]
MRSPRETRGSPFSSLPAWWEENQPCGKRSGRASIDCLMVMVDGVDTVRTRPGHTTISPLGRM